ncbi:MAG: hypothetical protein KC561_06535 [Myxococcales bacterium]|nr:hypothetical protein [Myxococcales bacterium]
MAQDAAQIPVPTTQRKAALVNAAAKDYTGSVSVKPIPHFDLGRTIFSTLEGKVPRLVIQSRIAKEPEWRSDTASRIDSQYNELRKNEPIPEVDPLLLRFLKEDCDFDVEHADGSFLDHLYFCYEYSLHHYPDQPPLVMLLHSILGTGTNTFAMEAKKIPTLQPLMSETEWTHVSAFPSVLRLLYGKELREELRANLHRLDSLDGIRFYRVIDNAPLEMSADDFWVQLNYQLIHLVDFLPVSNWTVHANDTAFIVFRDLFDLLHRSGRLEAHLDYTPARGGRHLEDEKLSLVGWLASWIPVPVSEKMASRSVNKFSKRIGHSMDYRLTWKIGA